jgi:hypothetical protein
MEHPNITPDDATPDEDTERPDPPEPDPDHAVEDAPGDVPGDGN